MSAEYWLFFVPSPGNVGNDQTGEDLGYNFLRRRKYCYVRKNKKTSKKVNNQANNMKQKVAELRAYAEEERAENARELAEQKARPICSVFLSRPLLWWLLW